MCLERDKIEMAVSIAWKSKSSSVSLRERIFAECTFSAMVRMESSEDIGSVELPESPRSVVRSDWASASLKAL